MIVFYAQPYIDAEGFYFRTGEEYRRHASTLKNSWGDPIEEFEIQFIDGEAIDAALAGAWGLNQANLIRFLEIAEEWDEWQKQKFIIAVGECGYHLDPATVDPDDFDIDIYEVENLRELAEQFVDEGLFGDIPERLQFYIDYDAIARDLAVDYTETKIARNRIVYRCG